ncbi:MAG: hypothetical protein H7A16_05445 [Sinobacteraceae bacterium]|nr:hypothetical protein [Nevskiaceae bacterium]
MQVFASRFLSVIGRPAVAAVLMVLSLAACGGGGDGDGGSGGAGGPGASTVTLTGTATFDRVPFAAAAGGGLDHLRAVPMPSRGVTIEAVTTSGQTVLASTTTDAGGRFTLDVPGGTRLFLRMKAELRRSGPPSWRVTVRDNTAGDALYVVDTPVFDSGRAAAARTSTPAAAGRQAADTPERGRLRRWRSSTRFGRRCSWSCRQLPRRSFPN